ncbi:MAG TPA: FAD-dependent oxidoreductase [Nocardioides sp.]|nr:FAD-dependent oxidoreductase [Nocardioides sp.]
MRYHEGTDQGGGASRLLRPRVAVVGGGPAGLTAAMNLAARLDGEVLVLEREREAGGIPRHSDHLGYGIRDLGRFTSGPRYAATLRDRALEAGAILRTGATVTDWAGPRAVNVTTPEGRLRVEADCVVLATGARERPRSARLIPGDRGRGVYTTGHLQNVVHLHGGRVGSRAVVVGGELVSWSAVMTLKHAGCRTVLMTSEYPRPESYLAFRIGGRAMFRTPVAAHTRVTRILGRGQVSGVEVQDLRTGGRRVVECDTVVLTGDWIPDNELARSAGIVLDPHTKGPEVDMALRTSVPGVFAVGNALHPVDTADVAALDGAAVADQVVRYLEGAATRSAGLRIRPADPIRWISPQLFAVDGTNPPRDRLLAWVDRFVRLPVVTVRQDGEVRARRRLPWPASPGRVFRIPASMLDDVRRGGGEVTIGIENT